MNRIVPCLVMLCSLTRQNIMLPVNDEFVKGPKAPGNCIPHELVENVSRRAAFSASLPFQSYLFRIPSRVVLSIDSGVSPSFFI